MDFSININTAQFSSEHKVVPINEAVIYDIIIIGGGPAALTAAVYCMRKGVKTALITYDIGGQVAETAGIENFMGYKYIEGLELVQKFYQQVKQFEISYQEGQRVKQVEDGPIKKVTLENGSVYQTKTLLIATGKSSKKLNVPGENEFKGKGVAYCAICDAPFYKQKKVTVVGGGNSGIEAAIDLAKIAQQVTLVQHRSQLSADQILIDKLDQFQNIDIYLDAEVTKIMGEKKVHSVEINQLNEVKTKSMDGIFIEIGLIPNTNFLKDVVQLNAYAEIIIDCNCRTSRDGIFAAGDVTSVPYKQIIIAAGEGAKAALSACDYIYKI